jgi:glutamate/tyrosine decarboxylase-like PLP-dependent enzyme
MGAPGSSSFPRASWQWTAQETSALGQAAAGLIAGAIDPVGAIADVCATHGVWLHLDGAYGGPVRQG